ncbi:MAG TPA: J domain-containing protein [Oscillospiraceae bacterium]|nr:J domain-containing protein [Oscillospiraceae bacterium]HPF55955.1 J domain-containing protein [Clostridiales bacterium]HPR75012.1 J domain-containing protein [Oscillospiraceae bacterium]
MDIAEVKSKLRKLKRLECTLRNSGQLKNCPVLVWDNFFDLSENGQKVKKARYDAIALCALNREQLKAVIDEYWAFVYGELFQENLIQGRLFYDRDALIQLGLPFDSDETAVKKRFRELAKIYHPDVGGDAAKFIELMNLYRRLIVA